jgi:hypothetical protein
MNDLGRFIRQLVPILGVLLVVMVIMALLAALGPALIPALILAILGVGVWLYLVFFWRPRL